MLLTCFRPVRRLTLDLDAIENRNSITANVHPFAFTEEQLKLFTLGAEFTSKHLSRHRSQETAKICFTT